MILVIVDLVKSLRSVMELKFDIYKAGGIIIKNRKFLVVKPNWGEHFISPGGKIDEGETVKGALKRELKEELDIETKEEDFDFFSTYYAEAAGGSEKKLRMDAFIVKAWQGEIRPSSEIVELYWIDTDIPKGMKIGSIFENQVLGELKEKGLIN